MSNYLITGITGFAGPHLANLLHAEGHTVYGLVRCSNGRENDIRDVVPDNVYQDITFLYGDLTNYQSLARIFSKYEFDGVFHLAAQSHPPTSFDDPLDTMNNNVMGSANLIQAISENQGLSCKLMFCSTSEVYGNVGQDGRKIKTTDTIFPANPYGASKAATDLYMQERMENSKINGFITRAFSHTGPRRGKNFSISSDAYQIARMMKGMQDKVLLVGNLESVRVVIDVRDTVRAYYLAMLEDTNKMIFNVCGNTPRKMSYFANKLIELSGLEGVEKRVHGPFYRPIDIHYQHGDSSNLVEATGWEPSIPIEQTLSDLLEYWVRKIT